jgi:Family of unknown function (DUF5335)
MLQGMAQETGELAREQWSGYFEQLSRDLGATTATVEVDGLDVGAQIEGEDLVLDGISYDHRDDIVVIGLAPVGTAEAVEHIVSGPKRIYIESGDGILPAVLDIEDAEGQKTIVRLRPAPALPSA